jgi:hypothetical protein
MRPDAVRRALRLTTSLLEEETVMRTISASVPAAALRAGQ